MINNADIRTCPVCGKQFTPSRGHAWNQETCGDHNCSQKWSIKKQSAEVKRYKRLRLRKTYAPVFCKVCGLPVERCEDPSTGRLIKSSMHKECILKDCCETFDKEGKLNNKQLSRLARLGVTLRRFTEAYNAGEL